MHPTCARLSVIQLVVDSAMYTTLQNAYLLKRPCNSYAYNNIFNSVVCRLTNLMSNVKV
jgi:hypothetical protein